MTHISPPKFATVHIREGYDIDEVDAFINEVVSLIRPGSPDNELAQRITRIRFTPVRIRRGYNMDQVDAYLSELLDLAVYGRRPT